MRRLLKNNFKINIHDLLLQRLSKYDDYIDLSNLIAKLVVFFSHILKMFFYPCKCIDVFVIDVEYESLALVNLLFIL